MEISRKSIRRAFSALALGLYSVITPAYSAEAADEKPAVTEQKQEKEDLTIRTRHELTSQQDSVDLNKLTLGLGSGTPYERAAKGKEWFRAYWTTGEENGFDIDNIELGVKRPLTRLTGLKDSLMIYGAQSSKDSQKLSTSNNGIGLEYSIEEQNYAFSLMADTSNQRQRSVEQGNVEIPKELTGSKPLKLSFPYIKKSSSDATHIGFAADYKTDEFVFGAGIDFVQGTTDKTALMLRMRYFPSETDQFGIAFKVLDEDGSLTKTLTAIYGRTGNVDVGIRAIARYDWNEEIDFGKLGFQLLLAQNPTMSRDGPYDAFVSNVPSKSGMIGECTFPATLRVERTWITQRTNGGFACNLDTQVINNAGVTSGYGELEAGYVIAPGKDTKLGFTLIGRYDFNNTGNAETGFKGYNTVGTSVYAQHKNLEACVRATQSMGEKPDTRIETSLQVQF